MAPLGAQVQPSHCFIHNAPVCASSLATHIHFHSPYTPCVKIVPRYLFTYIFPHLIHKQTRFLKKKKKKCRDVNSVEVLKQSDKTNRILYVHNKNVQLRSLQSTKFHLIVGFHLCKQIKKHFHIISHLEIVAEWVLLLYIYC